MESKPKSLSLSDRDSELSRSPSARYTRIQFTVKFVSVAKASRHSRIYRQLTGEDREGGRGLHQFHWLDPNGGTLRKTHRQASPILWLPRTSVQIPILLDSRRWNEDTWKRIKNLNHLEKAADSQAKTWFSVNKVPLNLIQFCKASGSRFASS